MQVTFEVKVVSSTWSVSLEANSEEGKRNKNQFYTISFILRASYNERLQSKCIHEASTPTNIIKLHVLCYIIRNVLPKGAHNDTLFSYQVDPLQQAPIRTLPSCPTDHRDSAWLVASLVTVAPARV